MVRWTRLGPLAVVVVASALMVAGPAYAQQDPPAPGTDRCTDLVNAEKAVQEATEGSEKDAAVAKATTDLCTGTATTTPQGDDSTNGEPPADGDAGTAGAQQQPQNGGDGQQAPGQSTSENRTRQSGQGGPASTTRQQRVGDQNCPDFANQREAQQYFESIGGSAQNNADRLDANHNGVACEDYFDDGDNQNAAVTTTGDDGSEAKTSGDQVTEVPEGSAQTGGF
ncbi:excalibur calcium-binding domain-containing protein [Actinomycetospora sp. OC33-EN08]|uniref:Excalibur calcium-binding domain-containing protein n=1 Tax=Actinomycetospora aurantiaca TaxID=3129233 RepID=A0ABU8MHL2_9PSEU